MRSFRVLALAALLGAFPVSADPAGEAQTEVQPDPAAEELKNAWAKVMAALPDAFKLGSQISSDTLKNVKKALEQASSRKTTSTSAQDQVAETEALLLQIEKLTEKLGTDVLKDVNRTVKELNEMSESIE